MSISRQALDATLVSAMFDGELSAKAQALALDQLGQDAKAQQSWQAAALLGDVLRETGHSGQEDAAQTPLFASPGFASQCAAALDDEPSILAPNALPESAASQPDYQPAQRSPVSASRWRMVAMAASVLLVASWVFSPFGLNSARNTADSQLASQSLEPSLPQAKTLSPQQAEELEALMVEHGEFTGLAALNGLLAYAKVVNQQVTKQVVGR